MAGHHYLRYEKDPYNEYQNFLYNRALNGLKSYPVEEVVGMHFSKKKRIIKVHKRAQTLINLWKQEITIILTNYMFQKLFPDSPITKELVEDFSMTDETFTNKIPFKLLRIEKADIIDLFIQEQILPKNFHELKSKQDASGIPGRGLRTLSNTESRNNS